MCRFKTIHSTTDEWQEAIFRHWELQPCRSSARAYGCTELCPNWQECWNELAVISNPACKECGPCNHMIDHTLRPFTQIMRRMAEQRGECLGPCCYPGLAALSLVLTPSPVHSVKAIHFCNTAIEETESSPGIHSHEVPCAIAQTTAAEMSIATECCAPGPSCMPTALAGLLNRSATEDINNCHRLCCRINMLDTIERTSDGPDSSKSAHMSQNAPHNNHNHSRSRSRSLSHTYTHNTSHSYTVLPSLIWTIWGDTLFIAQPKTPKCDRYHNGHYDIMIIQDGWNVSWFPQQPLLTVLKISKSLRRWTGSLKSTLVLWWHGDEEGEGEECKKESGRMGQKENGRYTAIVMRCC
ncbi:MAG: hypothetical protein MMC33_000644 [Icmadophila ericetorum]|nr:hypothetical protein [Icmadophila ericetorum]